MIEKDYYVTEVSRIIAAAIAQKERPTSSALPGPQGGIRALIGGKRLIGG
jgi:hypothetical protein